MLTILGILGLLCCVWLWNYYIKPEPIKMLGTIVLIVITILVILHAVGVIGSTGLR